MPFVRSFVIYAVLIVVILVIASFAVVAAQTQPMLFARSLILSINQDLPLTVDVVVPSSDGSSITRTLPLNLNVALEVSIDGIVSNTLHADAPKGSVEISTPTPRKANSSAGDQNVYQIGETFVMGDLEVTVNGVEKSEGDKFNKPQKGENFIAVDVSYLNTGTESKNLPSLNVKLKDSTGQLNSIDMLAVMATGAEMPNGEIAPGELIRGQYGFAVNEDATGLVLALDADLWDWGKYFVILTD